MPLHHDLEEQMRQRGLEIIGRCGRLSHHAHILDVSPLLRDFTPAEADLLGECMIRVRAQPGQLLITEGEADDWMMVLLSGIVDIGKRKIGAEIDASEAGPITRLAVIKEGAVIGEMSMLDGEPRYASCWALGVVEAAVLNRAVVGRLIAAHPGVGAKLLVKLTQLLAQRLRNTSNQLVKVLQARGPTGVPGVGAA